MKIYSFLLLFFWSFLAFGQSDIDVLHYDLNIILSKDSKQIQLTEALQIRLLAPTSQLKLDLMAPHQQRPGMKVSSVTAPYQNVKWKQTEEQLLIDLPAQLQNGDIQLFIQMSGVPSDGLIMTDNKFGDPTPTIGMPATTTLQTKQLINLLCKHQKNLRWWPTVAYCLNNQKKMALHSSGPTS
jgi:hypothetical protein